MLVIGRAGFIWFEIEWEGFQTHVALLRKWMDLAGQAHSAGEVLTEAYSTSWLR